MDVRYYSDDSARMPFGILVKSISSQVPQPWAWLVAAEIRIRCMFGKKRRPPYGVGFPGTERVVSPSDLPAPAIARWAPILEQLRDLGFEQLKCEIAQIVGVKLSCSVTLLDRPGSTVAILEWSRLNGPGGMVEITPLELDSYREDAPDIVTGVVRKIHVPTAGMIKLDSVEMINLDNTRPLAQRYQEHRNRCQGKTVKQLTINGALEIIRDRAQTRFDGLLKSGILRELNPQEIEELRQADLTELKNF